MNEITGFNLAVRHHPALVAEAETAADVAEALAHAVSRDLPVAVQATGHGAVQAADGAVLILTSRMRSLTVDPVERTATIGAGCTWAEVVQAAAPFGLAPSAGRPPGSAPSGSPWAAASARWPGPTASRPTTSAA